MCHSALAYPVLDSFVAIVCRCGSRVLRALRADGVHRRYYSEIDAVAGLPSSVGVVNGRLSLQRALVRRPVRRTLPRA